jgi:hypothetical protein
MYLLQAKAHYHVRPNVSSPPNPAEPNQHSTLLGPGLKDPQHSNSSQTNPGQYRMFVSTFTNHKPAKKAEAQPVYKIAVGRSAADRNPWSKEDMTDMMNLNGKTTKLGKKPVLVDGGRVVSSYGGEATRQYLSHLKPSNPLAFESNQVFQPREIKHIELDNQETFEPIRLKNSKLKELKMDEEVVAPLVSMIKHVPRAVFKSKLPESKIQLDNQDGNLAGSFGLDLKSPPMVSQIKGNWVPASTSDNDRRYRLNNYAVSTIVGTDPAADLNTLQKYISDWRRQLRPDRPQLHSVCPPANQKFEALQEYEEIVSKDPQLMQNDVLSCNISEIKTNCLPHQIGKSSSH